MPDYEQRFVAFVDILGFRSLIDSIATGAHSTDEIRDILRSVRTRSKPRGLASFRAASISDAVVLSSGLTPDGLKSIVETIERLALNLLRSGIFIRGALTKGLLVHDEFTVFGQGFNRAYAIETEISRFPRVLVTKDVLDEMSRPNMKGVALPNAFDRSDDGPWFVNILRELHDIRQIAHGLDPERRAKYLSRFVQMRDAVQGRLNEAVDNPRHFEKVQWFASYWNKTVPNLPDLSHIQGPGVYQTPIVAN